MKSTPFASARFIFPQNIFAMIFTLFFLIVGIPALASLSAHDIMVKNDEARRLGNTVAHAKMTTGGGGQTERSKEFSWWRKLSGDGVHFNTLTRFHLPPEVRNEGILFLEQSGKGDLDVQIYLPNFKKIRRIETGQQSSSFMGSEMSYSDIAPPHVEDFTYSLVREEACPGENKSVKCWVIESKPANDSVRDRTGVSQALNWIRQDNYMAAKIDSDDLSKVHWKSMDAAEIKEVDSKQHRWMSYKIHMVNLKNNHFTDLIFDNVKTDSVIPDSTFTPQNLSRESN